MAPTPPTASPLRGLAKPTGLTPALPAATLHPDRVPADAYLWAPALCRRGPSGRLAVGSGQSAPLSTRHTTRSRRPVIRRSSDSTGGPNGRRSRPTTDAPPQSLSEQKKLPSLIHRQPTLRGLRPRASNALRVAPLLSRVLNRPLRAKRSPASLQRSQDLSLSWRKSPVQPHNHVFPANCYTLTNAPSPPDPPQGPRVQLRPCGGSDTHEARNRSASTRRLTPANRSQRSQLTTARTKANSGQPAFGGLPRPTARVHYETKASRERSRLHCPTPHP